MPTPPPSPGPAALPSGLVAGRETLVFDANSVPAGLLGAHRTTAWAELVVVAGSVVFVDEQSGERDRVAAGERHVIVPEQLHHVEPAADGSFFVQFYVEASSGAEDG